MKELNTYLQESLNEGVLDNIILKMSWVMT